MNDIITKIEETLADGFLSKSEQKEIQHYLRSSHLPLENRIELIQQSINIAATKATSENYEHVFKWLKKMSSLLGNFATDYEHNNAFFAHTDDLRDKVIKNLQKSVSNLDICLFTISDNSIADTIAQCHRKGVRTRIVTDDDKMNDMGSDIYKLKAKGIPVKIDNNKSLMHHKFAVIDQMKVVSGSYNWTRTASTDNYENIIVSDNIKLVSAFSQEFDRLWKQLISL